jgi:ketosteroid isomerase-like protein
MGKKNGFNITLFVLIFGLFFVLSCTTGSKKTSEGTLLKADREFSLLSEKEGMFKAFLTYCADDGVILRDQAYPSKGKTLLQERFSGRSDTSFILTWEPLYEKISASGELGYTYGLHKTLVKATGEILRGTYVTIWLRQPDGSWKFVLDTGTDGLPDPSAAAQSAVPGQGSKNSEN